MKVRICNKVLERYPYAKVGFVAVDYTGIKHGIDYPEIDVENLDDKLLGIGMTEDTMLLHPDIMKWRTVFAEMGRKPSRYPSPIEVLLHHIFRGFVKKSYPLEDCRKYVSATNLLPIGVFDLDKLKGDLSLRFGHCGEEFRAVYTRNGFKNQQDIQIKNKEVVYSDNEGIVRAPWNHAIDCELKPTHETKRALYIVDVAFESEWRSVEECVSTLAEQLKAQGCKILSSGICDVTNNETEVGEL